MFQIPIKIPALEKRRKSIGLLHVVAGFFLFANIGSAYKVVSSGMLPFFIPFYILAFLFIAYGFFRKKWDATYKWNKKIRLLQAISFLIVGILFIQAGATGKSIGPLIWAALASMLVFTEGVALAKPAIIVDEKGWAVPNAFSYKKLLWPHISDVNLRSDFITIHSRNNRMLQFERLSADQAFRDQELQDFCDKQLNKTIAVNI